MGWYTIQKRNDGKHLLGGDDALDAFGKAVAEIASARQAAEGRLPTRDEMERAANDAFRRAGYKPKGALLSPERIRTAPALAVGALFTVPYGPGESDRAWG